MGALVIVRARARLGGRGAGVGRQEMTYPNYFLTRADWDQLNTPSSMESKVGIIADRLQAPMSLKHAAPLTC